MTPIATFTSKVQPYPASLYGYLPPPVRTASEALQVAVDHLADAQRAATAARAGVEAAQDADRGSARAAAEAGKLPATATLPAALDGLERAQRAVEAHEAIARDAQNAFVATQLAHLAETVGNLHDRQAAVRQVLDARLDEIAAGIGELHGLDHVLAELTGGVLEHRRTPSFRPVRAQGRRRRDLGEEAVAPIRAQLAEQAPSNSIVSAGVTAA
jgi:hypothetical protein